MTKLSHLHFVASDDRTADFAIGRRIWRVIACGELSLDNLRPLNY